MVDYAKCHGVNCKNRKRCFRFCAPSSYRQAYFASSVMGEDGTCEYWMPWVETKEEQQEQEDSKS